MNMNQFFLRSAFIFFISIFQYSFLNTAFQGIAPHLILFVAISWTLVLGFPAAISWIVMLGLVFDIISLGDAVGVTPFLLVPFSYVASFASKRFLLEYQGFSVGVIMMFSILSSMVYTVLSFMVRDNSINIFHAITAFANSSSYRLICYEAVFFLITYFIVLKMEGVLKSHTLHIPLRQ